MAIVTDRRNRRRFISRMSRRGVNYVDSKHRRERMFYLRLSISAIIILAAAVLKWTAAPINSQIHSVIGRSIKGGISYNDTVNAIGRVISGDKDVVEVFNDLTRIVTEPKEDEKNELEGENESETDNEPEEENKSETGNETNEEKARETENSEMQDSFITKDYYVKNLNADIETPEIECLSFQMSEEELKDDTQPVPFVIPPPSNCSYQAEKLSFKYSAPLYGVVTSDYGYRDHPFGGDASFHTGIDIAAKKGSNVKAFASGTVAEAGTNKIYGKYVLISHSGGFYSFYGHNSKLNVKKGTKVKLGDKIAEVGSTGMSTGPHLHFEIRKGSIRLNPKHYISPDCI